METVCCKRCAAIIGERTGDTVLLRQGRATTRIVAAASVLRECRHCGAENELAAQPHSVLAAVR